MPSDTDTRHRDETLALARYMSLRPDATPGASIYLDAIRIMTEQDVTIAQLRQELAMRSGK